MAKKREVKFKVNAAAERDFFRALKKVAVKSGKLVNSFVHKGRIDDPGEMIAAVNAYAKKIEPWARVQAIRMLNSVQKSNARDYEKQSKAMGAAMRSDVAETAVGEAALVLLHEEVGLISSLPIEAGIRAQEIAAKNFIEGHRAQPDPSVIKRLENELGMTTQVAVNRARLIARTETARANSAFVQARAKAVGAEGYIWRTTMDGAERHAHALMNGKFVSYESPPRLADGTQGHAGTFPNCRCWQDPVLPDDY